MLSLFQRELLQTAIDLAPVALVLVLFWARFLRSDRAIARRTLIGAAHIAVGLTLFRFGLDSTFLPASADLARSLSERAVDGGYWISYSGLVLFAVALGGAAAFIEPTLSATADRVQTLSGGTIRPVVLRSAVAAGFGLGLALGVLRLILGLPHGSILAPMVIVLAVLVFIAPRGLVPLALDSGAIATSVVTVPMIAVYGVAVADTLPGRSALTHGFGLIALAMVGSAITVLTTAYVQGRARKPDL